MLRITTTKDPQAVVLRLEGRLQGPWVAVLARCWSGARRHLGSRRLRVDLSGVTFVDAAGKAKLAELDAQGAVLLGGDIETKAIVAEIQTSRPTAAAGESKPATPVMKAFDLHEQLTQLQRLQGELHEVNQELARAAHPLERLSDLNDQQRQQVADRIRAGLARWEAVTQQISQVLQTGGPNGDAPSTCSESETR